MTQTLRNEQLNALATATKAGTIGTNQFVRLRDNSISVKELGVTGDGITNDTSALQAAANSNPDLTYPSATYKIATNATIGLANNTHHFLQGAKIHVLSGVTLTLVGSIDASSLQQIFQIDSGGTIFLPSITKNYPNWFGAKGDNSTDCTSFFNIAMSSLTNGGDVIIPFGTYVVNNFVDSSSKTIIRPRDNVNLTGFGYGSVIKIGNGLSSSGDWSLFKSFDVSGTLNNVRFSNFRVDCSGNPSVNSGSFGFGLSLIVFHIRRGADVHIDNIWIEHHMGANPLILGADTSGTTALFSRGSVRNCTFTDVGNDTGGYLQDHSTIYTVGSDIRIENNFYDTQAVAPLFHTFTADTSTDTLTSASHGLSNDQIVRLWNVGGGLPAPFVNNSYKTSYVVINKTTNTFQLANLVSPNSPIDITTGGSGTNYAYIPTARYHAAAIETHITNGVVANNVARNYLTGTNIGADTVDTRDEVVIGNAFYNVNIAFSLYQQHGFLARKITIANNSATITPNGVDTQCGVVTGDPGAAVTNTEGLDGLSILGNSFKLESGTVPLSVGSHGCFITNNILSALVSNNIFQSFPTSGVFFQPSVGTASNRIAHDLKIINNVILDCGTTAGVPVSLQSSDNDVVRNVVITDNHISVPGGGNFGYGIIVSTGGSGIVIRNNDVVGYTTAPELISQVGSTTLSGVSWQSISGTKSFETIAFGGVNGSIKTQAFEASVSAKFGFLTPSQVVAVASDDTLTTLNYGKTAIPNALVQMDSNSTITGAALLCSGLIDTSSAAPLTIGISSATSITLGKSGVDVIIPALTASQIVVTNASKHLASFSLGASVVVGSDSGSLLTSIGYSQTAAPFKLVQMDTNSTITGGAIIGSGLFDVSSAVGMNVGTAAATSVTLGKSGVDVIVPSLTATQFVTTNGSKHLASTSLSTSQVPATDNSGVLVGLGYSQAASPFKLVQMDTNSTITGGAFQGSGYYDTTAAGTMQVGANVATLVQVSRTGVNLALCGIDVTFGGGSGMIGIRNATVAPTSDPTNGGILYVEVGALKYRSPGGAITTIAPN